MNRGSRPNALLVELVIVLLFFALSATVILQLYVAAREKSVQAQVDSLAVLAAQDAAERFAASDLDVGAFLDADGWIAREGRRVKQIALDAGTLELSLELSQEAGEAGALDVLTLSVRASERDVLTLPLLRYRPGEVKP